ncbi:MAG: 1-phosphofructokinase family hexose kinase [Anaerolineae bacterium]|nr:1-phosphofructokinase family hexose kinase [Anaerolineae bacterium]
MIFCITPNPALDITMVVPDFTLAQVQRSRHTVVAAGGKGINVARAIQNLGGEPICGGFLGGHTGDRIVDLMHDEDLPHVWTFIKAETRTCCIVADTTSGKATVINDYGPTVSDADWEHFIHDVKHTAEGKSCICFSGSLPPGSPMDQFVGLVRDLSTIGHTIWVDTSGKSLQAMIGIPGIGIKVNDDEAGAILGRTLATPDDCAGAAAEFVQHGASGVAITLGARGAVYADPHGAWLAVPPAVKVMDAVGSGDSFLAGLVVGITRPMPGNEALAYATAAGTANAMSVGGGAFTRAEFESVLVETQVTRLS